MIGPDEFLLEDVRCFRGEHCARLRPITLLVGENSTGKTTFLGCYDVLHRLLRGSWIPGGRLDFNREPFSMGSFRDVVRSQRGHTGRIDEFTLGFSTSLGWRTRAVPFLMQIGFTECGAQPIMSSAHLEFDKHRFSLRRATDPKRTIFKTAEFETEICHVFDENWISWLELLSRGREANADASENTNRVIDYLTGILTPVGKAIERGQFFSCGPKSFRNRYLLLRSAPNPSVLTTPFGKQHLPKANIFRC